MFRTRPAKSHGRPVPADTLLLSRQREAAPEDVQRSNGLAIHVLARLSRRMLGFMHELEALTLQIGVQRVVGFVLGDAGEGARERSDGTVSLQVSKATLAALLSLTPGSFSTVLCELEHAGLFEVNKRDTRIVDVARLAVHQAA
jgi:CRP-like cAMP-binding protein